MKLPEWIEVTVRADGKPLQGVLMRLCVLTTFKNDFYFRFGPTDDNGRVVITRDEMIAQAKRDQELFIMDYGDPEIHSAGELVISIFEREQLKRAIEVYPDFKDVVAFPSNYLNQLQRAQEILANLVGKTISVDVTLEEVSKFVVRIDTDY